MDISNEAKLSALYTPWLTEIAQGPIPEETIATCGNCPMLAPAGSPLTSEYFHNETKCCAYQPSIPNFLIGMTLSDPDPLLNDAKETIRKQIENKNVAYPSGIKSSGYFNTLYEHTANVFGRAPALKCHHYTSDGRCSIWKYRCSVCVTWFCKHRRGMIGYNFWDKLQRLLDQVEDDLSFWCLGELGAGENEIAKNESGKMSLDLVSLGGSSDATRYRDLWGKWHGKEVELYKNSANLVMPLKWSEVLSICGPKVRILAELTKKAADNLRSFSIPERLSLKEFNVGKLLGDKLQIITYNNYNPLAISSRLLPTLRFFDGRKTSDALEAIQNELGLQISNELLQMMIDHNILVEVNLPVEII